jgi:hypothetical protein
MTHTFKLERLDGTPADSPSFKTTVLVCARATRSRLGAGRSKSFVSAAATRTSSQYWSSRTCHKQRLALGADVSRFAEGPEAWLTGTAFGSSTGPLVGRCFAWRGGRLRRSQRNDVDVFRAVDEGGYHLRR